MSTELDDTLRRHDDRPERIPMRAALLLRDVEGLPAEQVALLLDCSKTTVRSHIAHAQIKLREYLGRSKRRPRYLGLTNR